MRCCVICQHKQVSNIWSAHTAPNITCFVHVKSKKGPKVRVTSPFITPLGALLHSSAAGRYGGRLAERVHQRVELDSAERVTLSSEDELETVYLTGAE